MPDIDTPLLDPKLLRLLGGCRTWGASAANRPQRSIFHPLFAPWPGHGAANPAKNGLAGADFRYRRPKSDSLLDLLYTTRSVTRTAELLGQSQPTVSIWLGRLRRELSDPLFVRTPEGMQPTPRTDSLMNTVREVLEGLKR